MIRATRDQTLVSLIGLMLMGFQPGCQTLCMDATTIDHAQVTPLQPGDFITAEQLMPLSPRSGRLSVTLKPQSPRETDFSLTPDESGAGWQYTIDGLRVDHLQLSSNGDMVISSTDEIMEGVTVEYDPAFIELPVVLVMGKPFHQQCRMTVRHLAGGGLRDQG